MVNALENNLHTQAHDRRRADAFPVNSRQHSQRAFDDGNLVLLGAPDNLQVWCQQQPRSQGNVVKGLEAVFVA